MKHSFSASRCRDWACSHSSASARVYNRAEQDSLNLATAIGVLVHGAYRGVGIGGHDDAGAGGEMQVEKHVH